MASFEYINESTIRAAVTQQLMESPVAFDRKVLKRALGRTKRDRSNKSDSAITRTFAAVPMTQGGSGAGKGHEDGYYRGDQDPRTLLRLYIAEERLKMILFSITTRRMVGETEICKCDRAHDAKILSGPSLAWAQKHSMPRGVEN